MAKHSKKVMGKEIGSAEVYALPREGFGQNGYPNNVPNTQTQKTRGTGAATKGNRHSSKMG
jgi:hypothetical protein